MIQLPPLSDPLWSQDEAIAFEAARECLGDMMAICSAAIHEVKCTSQADPQRLANLEAELAALAAERTSLHVGDHDGIARVRAFFGQRVREYRHSGTQTSI